MRSSEANDGIETRWMRTTMSAIQSSARMLRNGCSLVSRKGPASNLSRYTIRSAINPSVACTCTSFQQWICSITTPHLSLCKTQVHIVMHILQNVIYLQNDSTHLLTTCLLHCPASLTSHKHGSHKDSPALTYHDALRLITLSAAPCLFYCPTQLQSTAASTFLDLSRESGTTAKAFPPKATHCHILFSYRIHNYSYTIPDNALHVHSITACIGSGRARRHIVAQQPTTRNEPCGVRVFFQMSSTANPPNLAQHLHIAYELHVKPG